MQQYTELFQNIERLKSILISRSSPPEHDTPFDHTGYKELRAVAMSTEYIKAELPHFVKNCRNLDEFWAFIQPKFKTYKERREFIRDAFAPLLLTLEQDKEAPCDTVVSYFLTAVDSAHVREAWHKALERRVNDPQGAITAARTLLECVCKHILDQKGEPYADEDLPVLYSKATHCINLAPDQHAERCMKQILGGCHSVVQGVGSVRNHLSDAHGRGKYDSVPDVRHAELMVNLSGAVATFLIATLEVTIT